MAEVESDKNLTTEEAQEILNKFSSFVGKKVVVRNIVEGKAYEMEGVLAGVRLSVDIIMDWGYAMSCLPDTEIEEV